ncbi:MAG: hypothetical protein EBR82_25270 [Caulobacteraceae bacterium]|nr:hypothetical protein [Caulobacteraceae bacterium]
MSPHNLKVWGLICAQNALIEMMKVKNESRRSQGHSEAYDDEAFFRVYTEIERLSSSIKGTA